MSNYSFSAYDPTTGLFDGSSYSGSVDNLLGMLIVKPNISYIMGEYDHLSQKVDLDTGAVVDYMPPQPGPRYNWNVTEKRWLYAPSAAEALWDAQQAAMLAVNGFYSNRLSWICATYPADEVTSWSKQEGEARAWTSNNAAPTPLLSAIAAARGVPFGVLVSKVIEKADLFASASGELIGARQRAEDRIGAAADPAAVEAIISEVLANP